MQTQPRRSPPAPLPVQALTGLRALEDSGLQYLYFLHADDDSFLRLDLLVPLLVSLGQ
jgi:hypothetical protein